MTHCRGKLQIPLIVAGEGVRQQVLSIFCPPGQFQARKSQQGIAVTGPGHFPVREDKHLSGTGQRRLQLSGEIGQIRPLGQSKGSVTLVRHRPNLFLQRRQ